MKLVKSTIINQPVDTIWTIAAENFSQAGQWMSGVVHTQSTEQGRVCQIQNKPDGLTAVENITRFDRDNHVLQFEVFPKAKKGPGLPVVKNTITVTLEPQGNQTKVIWHSKVELKLLGKLLSPLLRLGLGKFFTDVLDDLKVFAETGAPSERKLAFHKKVGAPLPAAG